MTLRANSLFDTDHAAIALYTKLGLREGVLHFDIVPAKSAA